MIVVGPLQLRSVLIENRSASAFDGDLLRRTGIIHNQFGSVSSIHCAIVSLCKLVIHAGAVAFKLFISFGADPFPTFSNSQRLLHWTQQWMINLLVALASAFGPWALLSPHSYRQHVPLTVFFRILQTIAHASCIYCGSGRSANTPFLPFSGAAT